MGAKEVVHPESSVETGAYHKLQSTMDDRINNHHQNTRATFYSRKLMVGRVLKKGMNLKEVAGKLGGRRPTVYKWVRRYQQGGKASLHNRHSLPQRSPRCLPVERVAIISAMRRMRMSGPSIVYCLSMPLSTVGLEIRCWAPSRLPSLETKVPIIPYEHENPGDMIHLDSKKSGRMADEVAQLLLQQKAT